MRIEFNSEKSSSACAGELLDRCVDVAGLIHRL